MIADVRRAVAVASYVMVTNRVASSVFDFTNGGYHLMSVSHTGNFLSVYDYQRSNYLSGYLPNLFDYSTASYVNMIKRRIGKFFEKVHECILIFTDWLG